ncbi:hypothetical protein BU600_03585 [Staphylococcus arlettae]|uniref:hypothetical protein n=1 Tax=Staphylococcus TaxID=1279 RepID=UPI000CD16F43|nr:MULTISPECIES: hypothetical protein [Staphylococcus]MCE7782210.1 hypothetical protein [Staphylococcus xylosus]MDW4126533.1 hypothetical protein [Staphylococcus saprophyticus]PNZ04130.1 hypothetical protein CD144_12100 [Staphylococcus equorum subsp. linens]PTK11287.1 hypothetical protein BUZ75_10415 [Staphylococcus saprophyticus]PTK45895.1 hypothetical protein BUZ69_08805 [Staphylococcus saprophyticus]
MKLKYLAIGSIAASLILSACDININMGSDDDSKSANKQNQKSGHTKNNEHNQSSNTNSNESTNSPQHFAKVWVSVLENEGGSVDASKTKIEHKDVSGEVLNPYNESASATYPNGTQALYGSPTAAGQVIYKDNNDGTVDVYNVPSHFQDKRWDEDDYSQSESNRILNNPKTVKLQDLSQNEINAWTSVISESNSSSESSSSDDSSNDSDSGSVTRENVIDKVEDYEGHTLDTSEYTYKEPEQQDNGDWGFSFTDKDGELAGSYIIDSDGDVTKYDENGDPE